MGQSSTWWGVCQADQLRLASGISESKRSCGTCAGVVWDMALTARQYEADTNQMSLLVEAGCFAALGVGGTER